MGEPARNHIYVSCTNRIDVKSSSASVQTSYHQLFWLVSLSEVSEDHLTDLFVEVRYLAVRDNVLSQ